MYRILTGINIFLFDDEGIAPPSTHSPLWQ
jgi:hypothetical protein